jgi:thiol-disulfide isomerase/thioredoxin
MRHLVTIVRIGIGMALALVALTSCGRGGIEVADMQLSMYQGADVVGGQEVKLSDVLAQGKPVVLNFWAGLCPPCRAEMPDLQTVYEQYKDEVVLLGVDIGPYVFLGSRDEAKQLLADLQITYPAGTTFDAAVVSEFVVPAMPTTIFITADGKEMQRWSGLLSREKAEELFAKLAES